MTGQFRPLAALRGVFCLRGEMTYSKLVTRTIKTRYKNQPGRGRTKIDHIILHHMASTNFEGVLHMWTAATREGSANYAVSSEGQVVGVVPEGSRSWSVDNAPWDARSITFEIENSSVGGGWPVSAKAQEATARVIADVCKRYRIPITRDRIIGHREVYTRFGAGYATACPGGLDVDWVVARAVALSRPKPKPIAVDDEEDDMKYLAQDAATKNQGSIYIVDPFANTKKRISSAARLVQRGCEALGQEKMPVAQVSAATLKAIKTVK